MKDKIYTEKEAKKLRRLEQITILVNRNIKIPNYAKEDALIKLLIDSNPNQVPNLTPTVEKIIKFNHLLTLSIEKERNKTHESGFGNSKSRFSRY